MASRYGAMEEIDAPRLMISRTPHLKLRPVLRPTSPPFGRSRSAEGDELSGYVFSWLPRAGLRGSKLCRRSAL